MKARTLWSLSDWIGVFTYEYYMQRYFKI